MGLDIYKHRKFPSIFIHIRSKAENTDNFIDAKKN